MNAIDYSLKLLSIGDYTESVLRQKLKTKGFRSEEIDHAVAFLIDSKIVDDRRYAENYIALKSNVYGIYRMRQYLAKKGVRKELLDELLDSDDKSSEYEAARTFVRKKLSGMSVEEIDRKKILGALARKGFSYSVASEVLRSELIFNEEQEEENSFSEDEW